MQNSWQAEGREWDLYRIAFALNPLMDKTHKKQVNKVQTTAYKNTYGTDNRLKDIYKVR